MNPIGTEKYQEYAGGFPAEAARYPLSYPELCSGFLTALSKAIKSAALYSLSHPVVIESAGRAYALLGSIFAAGRDGKITVSFVNDTWLFNEIQIPAVTHESQNLNAIFKAHGASAVTFVRGVSSFELGVLCELLATGPKGQTPGFFKEFLGQRGVTGIRADAVRYIKDAVYEPREAARPVAEVSPRPAAVISSPGIPPRPAASISRPAVRPAPEPRKVVAPPVLPKPVPGTGQGQGGAAAQAGGGSALAGMSLGALLTKLVESAVQNPQERVRVYEDALNKIKESLAQQVAQTTKSLTEENERIINTRTRTEKVLSRVAEGKVIVDKDGKILMMNQAAEELSGKRLSEVAGKPVTEHLTPGKYFITISDDMDLSSGAAVSGQVSVSGDEQMGQALRRSMALLQDDEGRVIGAYAAMPDMVKFNETQRLQEEFLSKVTHELQSPLSSISSALEMLTDTAADKLDGDENKFLAISVRNSRRLTEMIRGILDFSKLQSGKMTVVPAPVSVGEILAEAGEGLLPWARTKEITLQIRPPSPDVSVVADRKRIVQVLTNLISNALKSTQKGGTVLVAASRAATPQPGVVIGVRDTGHGIAKEDLKKIFDKFVQVESAEPREGVGLGLAIVSEIVSLHGGRIWAESEPGKGATFYFTLPSEQA